MFYHAAHFAVSGHDDGINKNHTLTLILLGLFSVVFLTLVFIGELILLYNYILQYACFNSLCSDVLHQA